MTTVNWDEWASVAILKRGADAELAVLTPGVKDWDVWLEEAKSQRLSLSLWVVYRDSQMARMLPQPVADALQSQLKQAASCASGLHTALLDASVILENEKIPFVLLSQSDMQDCFYEGESFTPSCKLLIESDKLSNAAKVLQDDGWKLTDADDDCQCLSSPLGNGQVLLTSTAIHGSDSGIAAMPSEVITIQQRSFRVPAAPAAAVLEAYFAVTGHRLKPAWIVLDVALAFSRLDRAGWQQAIELASRWDVVEEISAAVDAARERLGMQLPPGFATEIEDLRPGWLKRRALELTLRNPEGSLQSSIGNVLGRFLKR